MIQDKLSHVLIGPVVSEKATRAGDKENSVVFWVNVKSTKLQIKRAVETFFPTVKVKTVRTTIKGSIKVKFGQTEGRTKKKKKAYVTLTEGTQINFEEFQ